MTKNKLLIVDDQVENLQLLVDIFSSEGHQILAARNGDEALKIAQEELPDLILLDINMPTLSGYEVCEILQEKEETRAISIIFLSAQSTSVDEAYGLKIGAVDFISKPFVIEVVKQRVRIHLELQNLRKELIQCIKDKS